MKIIGILLLAAVGAISVPAQAASLADGVTVKDGKEYSLQGEQLTRLADNLEFSSEVVVTTNGTFKVAHGKERKIADGQVIRRDGWILNPDGSVEPVFDHVTMQEGKVVVVRDGQAEALAKPMTFPNKLSINPDGSCSYPDGSRSRLMDGQIFRLDGTPIPTKDTITMKNGRVMVQKEGLLIPISPVQIIGMNDGTSVRGDGFLQKRDGTSSQLREGQTILIEGALVKH